MKDLISEVFPPTIVKEAYMNKMHLIQTSGIYGMNPSVSSRQKDAMFTALMTMHKYKDRIFDLYYRRHTSNNKLKRLHKPMKRQGEQSSFDIEMKKWKRRMRKGC